MADLYRKSALEKISSPEQLDKVLKITSPISWLALIGIGLIVIATIIWSVFGTIPVTVSGSGIIASPVSTNATFADESGTVVSVIAREGMQIHFGDQLITYKTANEEIHAVYSDQVGTVAGVLVKIGDKFTQGSEIVRISPKVSASQVPVCYVKLSQSKKIERDMMAQIYLDSVNSQTYGHMWARVINIDSRASSTEGMASILGKDNNLASTFTKDGAVAAVTCELYPDSDSISGYEWSSSKGNTLDVSNGSPITVKIIVEEQRPIEKLFIKVKEIWGD